jgi:type IV pilus secretin PilQ/predicted competence protein
MTTPACRADAAAAPGGFRLFLALVGIACLAGCGTASYHVQAEDTVTTAESLDPERQAGTEAPAVAGPAVSTVLAPQGVDGEWLQVRGINLEEMGTSQRLVVDLSRAPDAVRNFRLSAPPRVVLDLTGPHRAAVPVERYKAGEGAVERVRVGHYDGRLRLVVDLAEAAPDTYDVRVEDTKLVVSFGDWGLAPAAPVAPEAAADPSAATGLEPGAGETAAGGDRPEEKEDAPRPPEEMRPDSELAAAPADPTPPAAPLDPLPPFAAGEALDVSGAGMPSQPRLAMLTKSEGPRRYTGKRISLDFKDADVQNVLRVIADVSGLNVVATDDVTGRITLHLVNVPWDQALDVVLQSGRLMMVREGDVLRISTVERVRQEQEELRAQQLAEKELEPLEVRYVRVSYARADKALLEKVQGVLTDRGSAGFDERTNTIIVRDIPRGVAAAVELIRNIDIQSPQVLIEANIVEATMDFAQALGIQWGYRHLAGPQTGNPTGMDFPGTVDIGGGGLGVGRPPPPAAAGAPQPLVPLIADFPVPSGFGPGFGPGAGSALDLALGSISGQDTLSARITALEEEGKGKIVSRPRVITMNNIPARIESLTILRVRLPSTGTVVNTGTGGVAGTASAATERIETGIILIVVPQVSSDGYILLNITAKSSQADFARTVDEIPTEISRQANSNVLIRDGETVVLGGIFRNEAADTETGMPYLRRIPAIGWLFKRMLKRDRKDEMIVFITPQVVAGYGAELPTARELWDNRLGS